ncbi:MAG: hypothetical protein JWQ99_3913 [Blastococcus sp.]|jgi:hypothetical protein|nr:hypothetical protein [Blastococcus sp.]
MSSTPVNAFSSAGKDRQLHTQTTAHRAASPLATPFRGRIRRSALRLFVAFLSLAAVVGFASPAGATVIGSSGATGVSSVGQGACEYLPAWGNLRVSEAPPTIYARNYRSGGGNDWQYVRYSIALIDAASGAVLQQTGYSGAAVAWDNAPARFSGQTSLLANWRGNYRMLVTIEWLDTTGRTVLGRAYQRVDSYRYWSNAVGPYGPFSSCAKAF